MKLDELDIALVERTPVQSTNLGLVLTRRYYKTLWLSALVVMLPFFLLSMILLVSFNWHWSILVFWWFKPLYDRVMLENLSQLILRQGKSFTDIIKSIRPACRNGLLANLTWYRFSTIRSFSLPIRLLEGQSGAAYRFRLQAMTKTMTGSPSGAMVLFLLLEQAITLTIVVILFQLLPGSVVGENDLVDLFSGEDNVSALILPNTIYVLVVLFLEPFFVSVGFSLYLNQRILNEAWDIDVIFRNMASRLGKLAVIVVVCTSVFALTSVSPVYAQTAKQTASQIDTQRQQQQMENIVSDPKITPYKEIPVPKQSEEKTWLERFLDWLFGDGESKRDRSSTNVNIGGLIKALLIGALFIAVLFIASRYRQVLDLFQKTVNVEDEQPEVMFGLDVRAEALPTDPQTQALQLIDQGNLTDALSLLYRCSLSKLIHKSKVMIRKGDTEGDCLRASKSVVPNQTYDYFSSLTTMWQNTVYAHQAPDIKRLRELANTWSAQRFSHINEQVVA